MNEYRHLAWITICRKPNIEYVVVVVVDVYIRQLNVPLIFRVHDRRGGYGDS